MHMGRRDRSRSPLDKGRMNMSNPVGGELGVNANASMAGMNPMMMSNMYQQGNMMMAGVFPNMMMPGTMMGAPMMQHANMEMMPTPGLEMMPQSMEMSMGGQGMNAAASAPIDMNMMGGMMMDPTMMGMGMYPNMAPDMVVEPEKEEIILKHCKLTPPAPGKPAKRSRRSKPPGCRTIFVDGFPEKIKESMVRDIFERYGRIQTLRLSKKNFCHIRFDTESSVDDAMFLSGYHIKLIDPDKEEEEETNHSNSGWLHVDYALSRDDQNEYEKRQRQAIRAQQAQIQQMNMEQETTFSRGSTRHRSPSPLRIQPFSNAAIVQLVEKIKSEEHFSSTLPTLLTWLERGECSKKNSNQFYSMIQLTNSHIRRLFNEKMQAEEELQECKERVRQHIEAVIEQLEQVAKVFVAASHQRVWDHFTKPQRKNIETWQKMTQEFKILREELQDKFYNEDMEYNNFNNKIVDNNEELQQLKSENESLQFQLEAYKNEVDVIKSEAKKEMEKYKAQFIARQSLLELKEPQRAPSPPPPPEPPRDPVEPGEAKLIGVISAFLQVHPQGASLDYVVSYVRALFGAAPPAVHRVLARHPDVFRRHTSGVGANIENRWFFVPFAEVASAAPGTAT